ACRTAARTSGRDVGGRERQEAERCAVRPLVLKRPVVSLEHGEEERQGEDRVRPHAEQRHMVLLDQRLPLVVGEREPGAGLAGVAAEQSVRHGPLPPRHGAGRVLAVPVDEIRVAVDGEEELVQEVLAHADAPSAPFGYQVKYASMVWNRSRLSTWSAATPSPAAPIISMKSMNP